MPEKRDAAAAAGNEHSRGSQEPRWGIVIRRLLASIIACGCVLRLTVRDTYPVLSVLYYVTPLGVLVGLSAGGLWLHWRSRHRNVSIAWLAASMISLGWWLCVDWRWQRPAAVADPQRDVRVLFWNVARWQDLTWSAQYIRRIDADVVALVEAGACDQAKIDFWNEHCPGYKAVMLGAGMQMLVKGSSGSLVPGDLGGHSIYRLIPIETRGIPITLCVVDMDSRPDRRRGPPLTNLALLAEQYRRQNLVIAGDFNTPADSVHFAPLRGRLRMAFEQAGAGYGPTWPVPLPVHQLDQIWLDEAWEVVRCQHLWTPYSDHRPVLATVRLR